jgi:hypothetical protein
MEGLTVSKLLNFVPINDREKELFNFDKNIIERLKQDLDNNFFYLGGQLKMKHDDIISLNSIEEVKTINKKREIEYGEPCNSFESASILNHLNKLYFVEVMIIKYNEIMELREKDKLSQI